MSEHSVRYALLVDRAATCASQGRYKDAERALKAALQTAEEGFGPEDPHTAAAMANLGDLYKLEGRFDEAQALMESAKALLVDIYGPDHPFSAWIRHSLGALFARKGDFAVSAEAAHPGRQTYQ